MVCAGCVPKPKTTLPSDVPDTDIPAPIAADTEWEVPSSPPEPPSVSGSLLPNGAIALGAPDAPHTLLVITHPSCRYCKEFTRHHLPRLVDAFVSDGSLRIDLLIRPLKKYPESASLAAAAICAAEQGRGSRVHDALADSDTLSDAALRQISSQLTLDETALRTCMAAPSTTALVEAAAAVADSLHADLVPTFVLDGVASTGLPEYAELRSRIDAAIGAR